MPELVSSHSALLLAMGVSLSLAVLHLWRAGRDRRADLWVAFWAGLAVLFEMARWLEIHSTEHEMVIQIQIGRPACSWTTHPFSGRSKASLTNSGRSKANLTTVRITRATTNQRTWPTKKRTTPGGIHIQIGSPTTNSTSVPGSWYQGTLTIISRTMLGRNQRC